MPNTKILSMEGQLFRFVRSFFLRLPRPLHWSWGGKGIIGVPHSEPNDRDHWSHMCGYFFPPIIPLLILVGTVWRVLTGCPHKISILFALFSSLSIILFLTTISSRSPPSFIKINRSHNKDPSNATLLGNNFRQTRNFVAPTQMASMSGFVKQKHCSLSILFF